MYLLCMSVCVYLFKEEEGGKFLKSVCLFRRWGIGKGWKMLVVGKRAWVRGGVGE